LTSWAEEPLIDQTISMEIRVPSLGWSFRITEVYQMEKEVWVVSELKKSPEPAAQMLTTRLDSIKLKAPAFPIRYYVIGKTWRWKSKQLYEFLKNREELKIPSGKLLYVAPAE